MIFLRGQENNLIYIKKIALGDVLIGAEFEVNHLDGNIYHIKENVIIKEDKPSVVRNLGMPFGHSMYGNLLIFYKIMYPDELIARPLISRIFPLSKFIKSIHSQHVDTCSIDNNSCEDNNQDRHPQGVQCNQQ